jgi:sugar phosphate isomerase/epimerase
MTQKFFLQSLSVFPASAMTAMDIAEQAGFDGLECFRFRFLGQYPSLAHYRREASFSGLELHFHEAWAWNSDTEHPEIRIPALWGGLLPDVASLQEQFGDAPELVVAYARHWREVASFRKFHPNWTLQTATTAPDGDFDCPFLEFTHAIENYRLPITLDTQHVLEYQHGKPGVGNLAGISSANLMTRLVDFFDKYSHLIREIHLNNFNPSKGSRRGRNLWPMDTEGALGLREFCQHVKAGGWSGSVTPELHPRFFSRYSVQKNVGVAKRLLEQTQRCWD